MDVLSSRPVPDRPLPAAPLRCRTSDLARIAAVRRWCSVSIPGSPLAGEWLLLALRSHRRRRDRFSTVFRAQVGEFSSFGRMLYRSRQPVSPAADAGVGRHHGRLAVRAVIICSRDPGVGLRIPAGLTVGRCDAAAKWKTRSSSSPSASWSWRRATRSCRWCPDRPVRCGGRAADALYRLDYFRAGLASFDRLIRTALRNGLVIA